MGQHPPHSNALMHLDMHLPTSSSSLRTRPPSISLVRSKSALPIPLSPIKSLDACEFTTRVTRLGFYFQPPPVTSICHLPTAQCRSPRISALDLVPLNRPSTVGLVLVGRSNSGNLGLLVSSKKAQTQTLICMNVRSYHSFLFFFSFSVDHHPSYRAFPCITRTLDVCSLVFLQYLAF